jgi:DNA-binding transcriptional LysR family regulator
MRFTLRQLQLFVAACETESVTLAAEREHLSQSAASSAIAQLERAVGYQLLIRRHAHGVTPTPAGRVFLQRARTVLREAGELDRLTDELNNAVAGTVDLGCLVTLAPIVLPSLCRSFREQRPEVKFRIDEAGQDELLRSLREGQTSLALTYDLGLNDDIVFQQLAALPPVAVLPETDSLAARDQIELRELAEKAMVLLDLPLSREYFLSIFYAQGLEPNIQHRSAQPEVVRSMVANGFGFTLYNARPLLDRSLDGRRMVTVPLSGDHRPMRLGIASLAGVREPRLVADFRAHCVANISDDNIPGMQLGAHGP